MEKSKLYRELGKILVLSNLAEESDIPVSTFKSWLKRIWDKEASDPDYKPRNDRTPLVQLGGVRIIQQIGRLLDIPVVMPDELVNAAKVRKAPMPRKGGRVKRK